MTRFEFAMSYANKSGMDLTELLTKGFIFIPCDCGEKGCEGWQAQAKENYMELGIHRLGVGEALSWSLDMKRQLGLLELFSCWDYDSEETILSEMGYTVEKCVTAINKLKLEVAILRGEIK